MDKIPMRRMQLQHLETSQHRPPCGGLEIGYHLPDALMAKLRGLRIMLVKSHRTGRYHRPAAFLFLYHLPPIPGLPHTGLPPGMRQLDADLTTLGPHEFDYPPQPFDLLILPDPQIMWRDPALRRNCRSFGKDQPRTTYRPAAKMDKMPVSGHPIIRRILTHRGYNNTVSKNNISDRKGRE